MNYAHRQVQTVTKMTLKSIHTQQRHVRSTETDQWETTENEMTRRFRFHNSFQPKSLITFK